MPRVTITNLITAFTFLKHEDPDFNILFEEHCIRATTYKGQLTPYKERRLKELGWFVEDGI